MNGTELKELIEKADNAYYAEDYDKAIGLYKQVLSLDADNQHAQEQIHKAEFYLSVKAVKPEDLMDEALHLCKRSRSFIAIGNLDGAKKLLQRAIHLAEMAGVDFINAKVLLENIDDVVNAMEFKKKAWDELEKRQWVKAEENLGFALDLDPTDYVVQKLLPHLRSLLKAQKLVLQLNLGVGSLEKRLEIDKEIQCVLEDTNETDVLSALWHELADAYDQKIVQVRGRENKAFLESSDKKIVSHTPKIFISYAHVDERHVKRLVAMLKPYEQQHVLKIWHDREITEGDEWYQEIQKAIISCDIALLLVSIDFLNSRFIQEEELPRLLELRKEKGLRIVPIIIRDCPWSNASVLKNLQALPQDGKPISSFDGTGQPDGIWTRTAWHIAELSKEIASRMI
jgi:hypothetical protein